jgi:hypothetical protein
MHDACSAFQSRTASLPVGFAARCCDSGSGCSCSPARRRVSADQVADLLQPWTRWVLVHSSTLAGPVEWKRWVLVHSSTLAGRQNVESGATIPRTGLAQARRLVNNPDECAGVAQQPSKLNPLSQLLDAGDQYFETVTRPSVQGVVGGRGMDLHVVQDGLRAPGIIGGLGGQNGA